ncbi:hypothetical protein NCS52_00733300 [Fusarium sp. LHS14.1]|nr:hypothetical protein NCS52_00733300 [Fusarium sp. LHS14.1]
MGCGFSKHERPVEANYVGTELIRMAPPTRRPGFRPEGSPVRGRATSLPTMPIYPPLYEHVNTGLHGMGRPATSAGIPRVATLPRIDITHDVIVEQDEAPAGTATEQANDAGTQATTTTSVEGGTKVATVAPRNDI